jgi:hypothetical protein
MQDWWITTPNYWTGFYLAPAPHHANTSWMAKRNFIYSTGWGFAILYVGRQSGDGGLLTAAQGRADAQDAAALAAQAGFPQLAFVFLDIETGGTLSSQFITYIAAWAQEMRGNTLYNPGIYCNTSCADQIKTGLGSTFAIYWVVRLGCPPSQGCAQALPAPSPSVSGKSYALAWQYAESGIPGNCPGFNANGNCDVSSGGLHYPVDLDVATRTNPSLG